MTSHEKRINALMRFHGLSKAEAEKRARAIEKARVRKNPIDKKHFIIKFDYAKARGGKKETEIFGPKNEGVVIEADNVKNAVTVFNSELLPGNQYNPFYLKVTEIKKNPIKRKTRATTQRAAESYVRRPSQITKRKPTRRLVVRRTKNLQSPRGVFPNPVKKGLTARPRKTRAALTDKTFHVQAATLKKDGSQQGPWVTLGVFPNEKRAKEYAKAYAAAYPQQWVRVTA